MANHGLNDSPPEPHTVEPTTSTSTPPQDLTTLSPSELISRITDLEARLKSTTAQLAAFTKTKQTPSSTPTSAPAHPVKPKKAPRPFDFSRYSTRHIALKFAYLGARYNGFEHANGSPPALKPTIEEVLWKALRQTRLIPTDVPAGCDATFEVVFGEAARKRLYWKEEVKLELDWTGLAYSKCGRTDRGVSAFGQVVGVRVRSNRPKSMVGGQDEADKLGESQEDEETEEEDVFDDVRDELPYMSILNAVLPPDVRILAWCPNPDPTFDARFSCSERRYKYFFTNPAFCPTPGARGLTRSNGDQALVREGWLDIEAMRKAAKKLEGLHDYRNLCKIDPSKQMSSCDRRIHFADIEEMPEGVGMGQFLTNPAFDQNGQGMVSTNGVSERSPSGPKVYAFAVHGTAFLWHQVRCMAAILFLVGQGLEKPELVDELLDVSNNPERPQYEMADDAPLVLWDCVFPGIGLEGSSEMKWIYAGDQDGVLALAQKGDSVSDGKFGIGGVVTDLWTEWREAKIKETLAAGLLGLAVSQGDGSSLQRGGYRPGVEFARRSQRIFGGDNFGRNIGEYTPVMQKKKMGSLEELNAKYRTRKQGKVDFKKQGVASAE